MSVRKKKPKKEFTMTWAFEAFDQDESFYQKRMFGGLAAYYRGRMVMVLTESPGERHYRGRDYDGDLWNGILLPTEKVYQESLKFEFEGLETHPVLQKWLYLPATVFDFEIVANDIGEKIAMEDPRLGIEPKMRHPKK